MPIREIVFYEVHGGTFISEGTFEAVVPRLRELKDLGWDRVMPVSQFPGMNWAARRVGKGPEFSLTIVGRDLDLHFLIVCQAPGINP